MKKTILHIIPALILVFAFVVAAAPSQASAAVVGVDWIDYVDRLYLTGMTVVNAGVSFDRSSVTWTSGSSTVVGASYSFTGGSRTFVRPFGNSYLDLSNIPLNTELYFSVVFETDAIYSGVSFDYWVWVEYYNASGTSIYRTDSARVIYEQSSDPVVCGFRLEGVMDAEGNMFMPAYCKVGMYFDPPSGVPIRAGIQSIYTNIDYDDTLKDLLSVYELQELGDASFELYDANKAAWFPDGVQQNLVDKILNAYFGVREDSVSSLFPGLDFDSSAGQTAIGDLFKDALHRLEQNVGVFAAVSAMFNYLLHIPYVSSLLLLSLALGVGALLLKIDIRDVPTRSYKSNRSDPPSGTGGKDQ